MPDITAIRGLRYDLGHVGSLSDVIAPPYDVIDEQLQDELYKQHAANVVRLILNREEPGDDDSSNRYTRAAKFLKNWRREGVLVPEADPSVYVYHQLFQAGGEEFTRRGFLCGVRLVPFGEGNIYPHEETHGAVKADRLRSISACKANLSPLFAVYPDDEAEAQQLLEATIVGKIPVEATDHLDVVHRIWPVSDLEVISRLSAAMGPKPMYMADGHHRYETACSYRDLLAEQAGGALAAGHPANYTLMMCVGMSDPGMIVLPTHRLFRGLRAMSSSQLAARLGDFFTCRVTGEGSDLAEIVWEQIESEDRQELIGLYTGADERWTLAEITGAGREKMAEIGPERSNDWRGLGVAILHRLIVDELLVEKIDDGELPPPKYVRKIDELVQALDEGDTAGRDSTGQSGTGEPFNLAAIVMPATLQHIRRISHHNERMPAKSTYFYPKLLSGLVINPLE
ncbi:MAG: DUF1015 domain-containing protein [Planctomycetes bacterium]|nr:DUF1015 domain-containing protein [Planctomycetota bacterium]